MDKHSFIDIKIPIALKEKLEEMMKESKYSSLSDFVVYVLREHIARYSAEKDGYQLSSDEEERIKKRLQDLGYLD